MPDPPLIDPQARANKTDGRLADAGLARTAGQREEARRNECLCRGNPDRLWSRQFLARGDVIGLSGTPLREFRSLRYDTFPNGHALVQSASAQRATVTCDERNVAAFAAQYPGFTGILLQQLAEAVSNCGKGGGSIGAVGLDALFEQIRQ